MSLRFSSALLACLSVATSVVLCQEGSWSVSASAGYAFLDFKNVDRDNASDVEGYRRAGYELPTIPSLRNAFAYGGRITYRFERDNSFSLSVLETSRKVHTSFSRPEDSLALTRSVGSTTVLLGLAQHFEPVMDLLDWYAELNVGILFGRANSTAYQTHTSKRSETDPAPITEVTDDTKGTYRKSKLIVGAGVGAMINVFDAVVLKLEASYRFAKVGTIDGEITTFGQSRPHTTSIDFDYSGFVLGLGVGIVFP
ncbi:MAG TPA: hypothetical protein VNN76_01820 [Bacteroidota bacterium]|nr:hypothetical protein [Bacteroidota bacterium]